MGSKEVQAVTSSFGTCQTEKGLLNGLGSSGQTIPVALRGGL